MQTLASPRGFRFALPSALRARRTLWYALGLSLAVHLAFTLWPATLPVDPDDVPLTATITELPPPPLPVAAPPPVQPPKPARRVARTAIAADHAASEAPRACRNRNSAGGCAGVAGRAGRQAPRR